MALRCLATEACKDGYTCPSVWVDDADPDHVIVVGTLVEPGDGIPMAAGERAVRLRRDTVIKANLA
ncbi:hypothetical protein PV646_28675 [Streptomyces sp. ID05-26A]|nr:hypothetical protein [Streptomyces sp. ID05-26A]